MRAAVLSAAVIVAGLFLSPSLAEPLTHSNGIETNAAPTETEKGGVTPAKGPLSVLKANPRYFTDGSGKAVYLTGSHVWNNLPDAGPDDPPPAFNFDAYLDFLQRHNHNFIRLWRWEEVAWDTRLTPEYVEQGAMYTVAPHPWKRTGPGNALDGKAKFDLQKFDPAYFERLRSRVSTAGQRGTYVSVMLFEGWTLQHQANSWKDHPFHPANNVNGIDGDADRDGRGVETHTLKIPSVTRLQEAYVRQVIDTVGDLDNVLFEIANESGAYSTEWQYHLIRFIKEYEKKKPKQHPVGMTFQYSGDAKQRGTNKLLFDSPADWISPNLDAADGHDYRANPPPADGKKVILSDTDHLWGIGGSADWIWKSFLRGHNPIFMDPYDNRVLGKGKPEQRHALRQSLGQTRRLAGRVDLVRMMPSKNLASTTYCLANSGSEYLVYQPGKGKFTVDLERAAGDFTVEWFDPKTDKTTAGEAVKGGAIREFTPLVNGPVVLYLMAAPLFEKHPMPAPPKDGSERKPDKPNILFIVADDQRWDTIAALGNPEITTPTLDALVKRGFGEGLNHKFRNLQQRAHGSRDEEYSRLKILTCTLPKL